MRLIAFICLFAAMLVAQAPAWLIANRIAAEANGWIELRGPTGTIWNGSADANVPPAGGTVTAIPLGRIAWRVARVDWTQRTLIIDIAQMPAAARPARVRLSPEQRVLSGAVRVPAAVALRLPQLAGWSAGGTLTLESESFDWNAHAIGAATVLWQSASIMPNDLPEAIPLGDVSGRIVADDKGVSISFTNAGGNVQLTGAGDSRTGQANLQVQPRPSATPAQIAWLQSHLMAQPQGRYGIAFSLPRN